MDIDARYATLVALFALVPIGAYAFGTPHLGLLGTVLVLASLSLIVGTLFLAFGPANGHDTSGSTA